MTKSPYEIRLDVLRMAQEICYEEKRSKEHVFDILQSEGTPSVGGKWLNSQQKQDILRSVNASSIGDLSSQILSSTSTKTITEKADELYKFVSDNKRRD